jgi:spermidine/putrescine ABC transporter ATP-binding subunit
LLRSSDPVLRPREISVHVAAVRLEHVHKKFGDTLAVDDVSFDVHPGEFLTMLGPSGCGKTTLLRMIAGFIKPSAGQVYIKGEEVTHKPPHKRRTGMVFQSYALFPHMTIFDNLAYGLTLRKLSRAEIASRIGESLELIRLTGYEKRYPRELSGGQQQRVALARAIIIQPDVLLLDEPLSNLDYKLRMAMRSEVRRIHRNTGITTIFVTHDQGEALTMSDRVVILSGGRVMQIGKPTDIYERPTSKFVADFIGEANFFEGKVISCTASEVRVSVGPLVLHAALTGEKVPRIGHGASVSVRPEKIRMHRERESQGNGDGANAYDATIEEYDYLGSVVRYYLRLGNALTLKVDEKNISGVLYRPGEAVVVEIPPHDCFVLPVEG